MRSMAAILLLTGCVAAFAKDKPTIIIQVLGSETSQRQFTRTIPGRSGTAQTNCTTNGTSSGTISDYGVGPIQTQSNGSADTNCTTTTTAATPPQSVTRSITQEHVSAVMPDGRHVVLWCQNGYRHCDYLLPGKYTAEVDGNALFIYVPELSGKEHKIKYKAVVVQSASSVEQSQATAQMEPAANTAAVESEDLGAEIATLQQQGYLGNAAAQSKLGDAYLAGSGVPKDPKWAAIWYRKAAEQGDEFAQYALGLLYDDGIGVPQDYAQAAIWYRKAAEQGDGPAQMMLGLLYSNGLGVSQDYVQAFQWIRKAAEQGDGTAQYALGAALLQGKTIATDYAESYFWLELAAGKQLQEIKPEDVIRDRDEAASHVTATVLLQTQERARKWSEDHPAKP
jgi:hypothetical protein